MHRGYAPLIVAVAAGAVLIGWGAWRSHGRDVGVAPVEGAEAILPPRFEGVASCASRACHNGNGPPGSWRSEYTTWATCDPHGRAYTELYSERSRRIQENLNRAGPPEKRVQAEKNPLCLKCHATDLRGHEVSERFTPVDGVGCESCHGPSGFWRALHYQPGWKEMSVAEKAKLGFINTKDLRVRAEGCVRCHIGSVDGEEHPDQEVNHDLVAAGHPRLRFEYGAYLANYPKHWSEAAEKKAYPDFEARAWMIGQVASARAALRLLRARAAATEDAAVVWPEFAEHDCYSCHHDLTSPSWRRQEQAPGRPGQMRRNPWYTSLAQTLAPGGAEPLTRLDELMTRRVPDRAAVAREAENAAAAFAGLKVPRQGPADIRGQLLSMVRQGSKRAGSSPDDAMQFYLAVAALHHALGDLHQSDPGLKGAVAALGHELNEAFWSPPGVRPRVKYDSPRYLDREQLLKKIQALRAQLGLD
jgi:hypothetical protein